MKKMRSLQACLVLVAIYPVASAHAATTYKWIIKNNFPLSGNPVQQLDPPTCTGMNCPVLSPTSFPYGSMATAVGQTTGSNPQGEVYVGYQWTNGVDRNECGFAIAGGTVASDGSSTRPNAFPYLIHYTNGGANGSTIYPGCVVIQQPQPSSCDTNGKNCTWTATFQINQTR